MLANFRDLGNSQFEKDLSEISLKKGETTSEQQFNTLIYYVRMLFIFFNNNRDFTNSLIFTRNHGRSLDIHW